MRLIYLDQRDLVLLARARKGKPDAGALRAIHDRLREFAIAGLLLAPLSESHCFEIWNIGNQRRRQDLAEVALCMSRRVAVAPLREIWRIEFGQLLAGLGAEPPRPRSIFGLGVRGPSTDMNTSTLRKPMRWLASERSSFSWRNRTSLS